jgi:hypothetical protein
MYISNQFLAKLKTTSTGKQLDSQHRNDAVAEFCSGRYSVTYGRHPEWKLPSPPPSFNKIK